MAERIPTRLSPSEGRKFALTVGGAFLVLGGVAWWRGHVTVSVIFWSIGGALVTAGLLLPAHMSPVHRAWMGFALALSKVTTPVFMSVVFFLAIAPIGILMRLLGRNPLRHESKNDSFWITYDPDGPRGTMKNQF